MTDLLRLASGKHVATKLRNSVSALVGTRSTGVCAESAKNESIRQSSERNSPRQLLL